MAPGRNQQMTTVSIVPEPLSVTVPGFRAISGRYQSIGNTPGEALDALTSQLSDRESGTLLVIQHMRPDRFFNAEQRNRLTQLMTDWREARDRVTPYPAEKQAELEQLIDAELEASTRRAVALLDELQP